MGEGKVHKAKDTPWDAVLLGSVVCTVMTNIRKKNKTTPMIMSFLCTYGLIVCLKSKLGA
ncbi:hypothetical protein DIT68_15345 [Brumimicrobium oceani]|uniref:Uncharacterized protein n=1 Tax=Brumimicrobium oceani TaxID=2100725 RepID=A0A2U2X0L4_9FLAO|nr:hypothetical protein DIT68_15345 [Brumimicrobium oceani]